MTCKPALSVNARFVLAVMCRVAKELDDGMARVSSGLTPGVAVTRELLLANIGHNLGASTVDLILAELVKANKITRLSKGRYRPTADGQTANSTFIKIIGKGNHANN